MGIKVSFLTSALLISSLALASGSVNPDPNDVNPAGATPGVLGFDCDGVCQKNLSSSSLFKKRTYDNLLLNAEGATQPEDTKPAETGAAD